MFGSGNHTIQNPANLEEIGVGYDDSAKGNADILPGILLADIVGVRYVIATVDFELRVEFGIIGHGMPSP